jgi:single-stranded DNA-binding protein
MHLNRVIIVGRVSNKGPRLTYDERGIPTCSMVVEVDEPSKTGKVFTTYLPVEVVGKYAEEAADALESGDDLTVEGKLKFRSVVDAQTGQKASKMILSTWTVTKGAPAHAGTSTSSV